MLTVDPRGRKIKGKWTGSKKLVAPLRALGLTVAEEYLGFGDVSIIGDGPGHRPVPVGIEHKTLGDVLQCIQNGRFAGHQLPGMQDCYEVCWLLIEGEWRTGAKGRLEVRRGRRKIWGPLPGNTKRRYYPANALDHWITTMVEKAGLRVWYTRDLAASVSWIKAQYEWWTEKGGYDRHRAHLVFDRSQPIARFVPLVRPSYARKVAAMLPFIGWERSAAVTARFRSVDRMINASEKEWAEIDGIGKGIAKKVRAAILQGVGKNG